jgi:hypothetical protein
MNGSIFDNNNLDRLANEARYRRQQQEEIGVIDYDYFEAQYAEPIVEDYPQLERELDVPTIEQEIPYDQRDIDQLAAEWLYRPQDYLAPEQPEQVEEQVERRALTVEEEVTERLRIVEKTSKYFVTFDEWIVDALFDLLTAAEWKAFTFADRRILNFDDKKEKGCDTIAQSQFTKGIFKTKTGERLQYGCGLGETALANALKGLRKYGVMPRVAKYNYRDPNSKGDVYMIQRDATKIDWTGLVRRKRREG